MQSIERGDEAQKPPGVADARGMKRKLLQCLASQRRFAAIASQQVSGPCFSISWSYRSRLAELGRGTPGRGTPYLCRVLSSPAGYTIVRIPGSARYFLMMIRRVVLKSLGGITAVAMATCSYNLAQTKTGPVDSGVRGGTAGAGGPLQGLTADETAFFQDGQSRFADVEVVTSGANNGLGARFNSNQCLSCHSQPSGGGSSPSENPLPAVATLNGAKNTIPWFV